MKKILLGLVLALVLVGFASAAKVTKCATIQDGTILDAANNPITLGYDKWGYNYQAHMFNGWYDNFARPSEVATSGDILMMKWNDAWLSNKDCDGDKKLDRHYPLESYIGSGAWLTNHAWGTYEGTGTDYWDTTGSYILSFEYQGGYYAHDMFLTDTNGVLTGNGGYPNGNPYSFAWTITSGTVTGNVIDFYADYTVGAVGTTMHVTGTIANDGTMSGTWSDNYNSGLREGTWQTTTGGASGFQTCYWSDFVKIIAVPADAVLNGDDWYTTDEVLIGPSIWGSFAIIQEVSTDPCGEGVDLMNYQSELRSGLGNW